MCSVAKEQPISTSFAHSPTCNPSTSTCSTSKIGEKKEETTNTPKKPDLVVLHTETTTIAFPTPKEGIKMIYFDESASSSSEDEHSTTSGDSSSSESESEQSTFSDSDESVDSCSSPRRKLFKKS